MALPCARGFARTTAASRQEFAGQRLTQISPSWSAAKLEDKDGRTILRVRCKREDFPNKEAQKECLELTTGMLMAFITFAERLKSDLTPMIMAIGRQSKGIEHREWED